MGIEIRVLVLEILEGKRWNGGRDEFLEIRSFLFLWISFGLLLEEIIIVGRV